MLSVGKLNILQTFFQKNCFLCGAFTKDDLCKPCREQLPRIPNPHCPICLLPVSASHICGACLTKPPAYTHLLAALHYTFPVDAMIHSLKYQSNLAVAPIMANLLIEKIVVSDLPDLIIPMPLHPIRLRERGFNQAVEIGRYISQKHKINLLLHSCIRVRNTSSQAGLPWKARQKNIRNAFACKIDLSGKHVAILDDVLTSGTTINELATVLRQQGAATISGWVVARTLPTSKLSSHN